MWSLKSCEIAGEAVLPEGVGDLVNLQRLDIECDQALNLDCSNATPVKVFAGHQVWRLDLSAATTEGYTRSLQVI